jgi:4-amino-4-deoxy-L-arabinose transferase-like glycosyltransferase
MVAIARTMLGRWTSLWCGLVMATTYDFFHRAGSVSLDVWQLLFMMIAVAMAARGVKRGRVGWLVWAGVPIGLALMCKPFMALLAVPLLGIWLALIGRARWLPWLAAATLVACAVAAPWHVSMYAIYGRSFVDEYLGHEVVQRAMGEMLPGHRLPVPVWFYLGVIATRYWPWLLPMAGTLVLMAKGRTLVRDHRLAVFAIVWSLGWLIALSVFPDRRDRYDLPIFTGTSILAAMWLSGVAKGRLRRGLRKGVGVTVVGTPVVSAIVAAIPMHIYPTEGGQWEGLGRWASGYNPSELWNAGVGMAQCGSTYMVTGVWPRGADRGTQPPPGSLILYHSAGGLAPGDNESVLLEQREVKVTRLDRGIWQPRAATPAQR